MNEVAKPKNGIRAVPAPTTFRSPEGTQIRMPSGRYTDKVARQICDRIIQGKSLKEITDDPRMPGFRTVMRWLGDPRLADFREMYYYARRVQAEVRVDEIFAIADNTDQDWTRELIKGGDPDNEDDYKLVPNNEAIQRSRVRIDTRKWFASKMMPRLYGDNKHVDMDVTGDLADLLKSAANKDDGLPPPIEGETD